MNTLQRITGILLFCFSITPLFGQKQFVLKSPDNKLQAIIKIGQQVKYSIHHDGDLMLDESPISMKLSDGKSFGIDAKLSKSTTKTVNGTIESPIYKKSNIIDNYNELQLKFKNDYDIIFRAYNDGIAYRFVSHLKKPFTVENEQAVFNFPKDYHAYIPYVPSSTNSFEEQFLSSFENTYEYIRLSEWDNKRLAILPLVVEGVNGKKVCITEADLLDYPGMYLHNGNASNSLTSVFAPYPKEIEQGGHNQLQGIVRSREAFIAKCKGKTNFPWRAISISENDKELLDSDLVYKLATPAQGDFSWIKPGKVAWDWWNDWNLYGVDFRSGVNNETYKYYIDFASQHGIEYIILDEGWAVNLQADLMQVVPELDLPMLVDYAAGKNVDLILWAGYLAFDKDIEGICKHYSAMGIKGFKVDFMDRDDQIVVDFHRRASEIAAKYHLLLNFHGTYKPTGLQRTYPNAINFEGVLGLEFMKWATTVDQVSYDVTMPFIRMVAGPMDYTQGAMRNAIKDNYCAVNTEPMSQGTRCRQLAQYIIFESPLSMLCDNPSNYMREKECLNFIASVPTTWDNTITLDGKIGEHIVMARQKGEEWYVGTLTNWDKRTLEIDLSFLGAGTFRAEIFKDGINADKAARDYVREIVDIPNHKKLTVSMAPGGGCAIRIFNIN